MYPRRKDLFTAWSKAMVEGSTVDKPNYPGKKTRSKPPHAKRKRRRKKNNAKKD